MSNRVQGIKWEKGENKKLLSVIVCTLANTKDVTCKLRCLLQLVRVKRDHDTKFTISKCGRQSDIVQKKKNHKKSKEEI